METRKILVVDDELLIRDLLYDHFAAKDYRIATAESAEKAIEILDGEQEFDVVLTDIKMPGMDGLELIDRIKNTDADLPIIIMTGFPSLETAIEALRKRVYDYVVKPFNINRLCATVEAAAVEYQQKRTRAGR
ncbi:MAG: response regulator [candidate division Zixibacteria bacterium]|nr:response regulator [candidate division Zixibacteria bacterium]